MSVGRIILGILFISVAVIFLLFSIIPAVTDNNQFVLNVFEPIYCGAGEQLTSRREVGPTSEGGIGMTAYYTCMRADESTYDATGKMFAITGGVFTGLLLLGILLIIFGSRGRRAASYENAAYGGAGFGSVQTMRGTGGVTVTVNRSGQSSAYHFDTGSAAPVSAPDDLFSLPLDRASVAATPDLQEKLQQLQEAYDLHLISRDEYDRKRMEILSEF